MRSDSAAGDIDLTGFMDIHVHTAPDVRPRFADDVEAARQAVAAGMRAILLKSHVTLTADRAAVAEKVVGGDIKVFGSLALNLAVGGFNPYAVEAALRMGARQIWMPTIDAANERSQRGVKGGLWALTAEGRLRPEIYEILLLLRQADAILGTGHLAVEEIVPLVKVARELGLRRVVVTHPEAPETDMDVATQKELAGPGVFFERCYVNTMPAGGGQHPPSLAEVAAQVRAVGVASTVLTTDFGLAALPPPVEGLRAYLAGMAAAGFAWAELRQMAAETPAYLLGL